MDLPRLLETLTEPPIFSTSFFNAFIPTPLPEIISTPFFDEILSGIRINCSSVQTEFGINTGISNFGKIIGGAMPIGVIGIRKDEERRK